MKLCQIAKDGGPESHVTGFFLVEIKSLFSVVILHFGKGSREAFHSHAFNAVTFWLKGKVKECLLDGSVNEWKAGQFKHTSRQCFHRVVPVEDGAWAISFRGPWGRTWREFLPKLNRFITLTTGRKVIGTITHLH